MQDESLRPIGQARSPPDHPARIKSRNRYEAGLLARTAPAPGRLDDAFPRRGAVAVSILFSAYSCGGSRGLYRVPVLAAPTGAEPRSGKATHHGYKLQVDTHLDPVGAGLPRDEARTNDIQSSFNTPKNSRLCQPSHRLQLVA
jgi:hypothetical protein